MTSTADTSTATSTRRRRISVAANAEPAIPEKTIKSQCKDAGGTYVGDSKGSSCTYKDIKGNEFTDWYDKGHFVGTTAWRDGVKPAPPSILLPTHPLPDGPVTAR